MHPVHRCHKSLWIIRSRWIARTAFFCGATTNQSNTRVFRTALGCNRSCRWPIASYDGRQSRPNPAVTYRKRISNYQFIIGKVWKRKPAYIVDECVPFRLSHSKYRTRQSANHARPTIFLTSTFDLFDPPSLTHKDVWCVPKSVTSCFNLYSYSCSQRLWGNWE